MQTSFTSRFGAGTTISAMNDAQTGDIIEVDGVPGNAARNGVVTEVLGAGEHTHLRVRWDEEHETLFYPGSGESVHLFRPDAHGGHAG